MFKITKYENCVVCLQFALVATSRLKLDKDIKVLKVIFINKLFEIDFETNVSDKSFIEEQRFEAIIASLSSSNNKYR